MHIIRQLLLKDAKIIANIHKKCFSKGWEENAFVEMLSNEHYFGFLIVDHDDNNDNCFGFIICKFLFEEVEIITICVQEKWRKQGFAKLLIKESIGHSKKTQRTFQNINFFLEVAKDNNIAINLYKSIGFTKISERAKYYETSNGLVDADVMVLTI